MDETELTGKQNEIEKILGDSPDIICADYRYGFIHGITQTVLKRSTSRRSFTDKLDKVVLNRVLGIPIFLAVIYLVFWATIAVGGAFIDFFDILFGTIFVDGFGVLLERMGSPGWLTVFLAGGIGGGLQMVATFVPILFMMFFMLAILDDSGYMARAAFVMDRFMRFLGLPGKAFVPLLVGFGCTVPAIMATRTLETKKERYLTIFMAPFMSCGARLPVYALFAAAFFSGRGGLMVFSLYLIGIILAVLSGFLMKKTLFRGEASSFIMELPPYHLPRFRHIMIHTWDRLKGFIWRAGKVIVLVVIFLSILNSIGKDGSIGNEDSGESILSVVGKAITPVFKPMGIEEENWPATVGIFTGLFAKEAVVGTLNSLYGQMQPETEAEEEEEFDFWGGIRDAFVSIPEGLAGIFGAFADPLGTGVVQEEDTEVLAEEIGAGDSLFGSLNSFFSGGPAQAYAYLLFILIYFPCIAAFGAIVKETGMFFGLLNGLYLTILAWITATLFYQVTTAHNPVWIIVPLAMIGLIILSFMLLGKRKKFS
jgi:ferrous iron transport protein B